MRPQVSVLIILVATLAAPVADAGTEIALPYEREDWVTNETMIDELVLAVLEENRIKPAHPCSDEVFFRRVYVDLTGTLPEPEASLKFLADRNPQKRAVVIDELLETEEFADYATLKWCDILRVKAEFPINLWPNGVQAYYRWLHDAVRDDMPYDQFARALLTSSGSNFRVAPVNFYRAIQGTEPRTIATAVALTFMGTRLGDWPEEEQANLTAFFSRVGFKGTAEWKETIVSLDPAATEPLDAILPDGTPVHIAVGEDPRVVFADWLITPGNPWFARSIVNRVWSWLIGRGIIHEPDDIHTYSVPVNPELLDYLEQELVENDYDLQHLYWRILNSRTYQQSSISQSTGMEPEAYFAHYMVRPLGAEVLMDALCWLSDTGEGYSSAIPEPFTWVPDYRSTVSLADGSTTSQFLVTFGRPSRDTGLESERNNKPTDGQRLYLLNASDVQRRIQRSPKIRQIMTDAGYKPAGITQGLYLLILSREPTREEMAAAADYFANGGQRVTQATVDLAWALVNTKEFLYKH